MIPFVGQINRLTVCNKFCTFFKSLDVPAKVLYPLKNRGLVKVSGPEAAQFLQGLITNDMNHFDEGAKSIYAMFLNNDGRVLYDTLVHKWGGETDNVFMLECDLSIQYLLRQHLKMHKLKQNVKVENVSDQYKLWVFIAPPNFDKDFCETVMDHEINVYKDPRLADLGHRLITTPEMGKLTMLQAVGQDTVIEIDEQEYTVLRYKLGVSEGTADIFPGTCYPLELNCDYLQGVSFQKIYYIGRELINASIEQAGVKRIMPIHFLNLNSEEEEDFEKDYKIWANRECGQMSVGKLKSHVGSFGLGLLKVKEALEAKTLHIGSCPIVITQPDWWPKEILSEK